MNPHSGLNVFANAWSTVACDLLRKHGVKGPEGKFKGAAKAITKLQMGAFFLESATKAAAQEATKNRIRIDTLVTDILNKEAKYFGEFRDADGARKRVRMMVNREMDHLVAYGLFKPVRFVAEYDLTDDGLNVLSQLSRVA